MEKCDKSTIATVDNVIKNFVLHMQQIMKTDMDMNIKLFRLGGIKKKQTKTEDWQRFIIEYVKGMSTQ